MSRYLTESGAIEMLSETQGAKNKYAFLCANAHFNDGQEDTIVWGNKDILLIPSRALKYPRIVGTTIKQVGGLKDVYE